MMAPDQPHSDSAFVAIDTNWNATLELYIALASHLPGLVIEAKELRQAASAGWLRDGGTSLTPLNAQLWRRRFALPAGWFHTLNALSMPILARLVRRSAEAALHNRDLIWFVTSPYYHRLIKAVGPRFSVYHVVDDYRYYWPRLARRTERLEAALIAEVDLVVCVSRWYQERLQQQFPSIAARIVHVPNGAPELFFNPPDTASFERVRSRVQALPRPLFCYTGNPQGRVDSEMIRALAQVTQGSIVFAGPNSLPEELRHRPNILALGHVPLPDVPALLCIADVLLIPQADTGFNRAACPRKLWEYCASGKPIVGARLTEIDGDRSGIRLASSPEEFVQHAMDLVRGGDTNDAQEAREQLAQQHRYPTLAARLLQHLTRMGAVRSYQSA